MNDAGPIEELLRAVARISGRHWGDLEYVVKITVDAQSAWSVSVRHKDSVLFQYDHHGPDPEDAPTEAIKELVERSKKALSGPVATSMKVLES